MLATTTDHTLKADTNNPALNLATIKAQALTTEQISDIGFDHGFRNKGARGSLSAYPAYWEGRAKGRAARF